MPAPILAAAGIGMGVSAASGFITNTLNRRQANRHHKQNLAQQDAHFQQGYGLQRDKQEWNEHISRNQMRYKVKDAAAAGIHPSVAAGGAATGIGAPGGNIAPGAGGGVGAAQTSPILNDALMGAKIKQIESDIQYQNSRRNLNEIEGEHRGEILTLTADEIASRTVNYGFSSQQLRAARDELDQRVRHNEATHTEALSLLQAELGEFLRRTDLMRRSGITEEQLSGIPGIASMIGTQSLHLSDFVQGWFQELGIRRARNNAQRFERMMRRNNSSEVIDFIFGGD
jgi:hypothetical protein